MNDPDVDDMIDQASRDDAAEADELAKLSKCPRLARVRRWARKRPKRAALTGIGLTIALIFVIPTTRYTVLGLIITRDTAITVVDSQTGRPVSAASVTLRGLQAQTDANGIATFTAQKPGKVAVSIDKKHYTSNTSSITIGARNQTYQSTIQLQPTGRQVPVRVTNKISGDPIPDATILAGGTQATTDSAGSTQLVLDATAMTAEAEISADGFVTTRANLTISEDVSTNTITLTPTGKVYVLSKQTGNLDVVKLNLDGSDRQIAVPATGNEEIANTYLVPSSDWKFVLLHARREGNQAALYIIDTTSDKVTAIDTTDATFDVIGWSDHKLIYTLERRGYNEWQSGRTELKQFDADNGAITSIDKTAGTGDTYFDYATEYLRGVQILGKELIYTKVWSGNAADIHTRSSGIYSVNIASGAKQAVRSFAGVSIEIIRQGPNALYIQVLESGKTTHYTYQNQQLVSTEPSNQSEVNTPHGDFLVSATDSRLAWSEPLDGKFRTYVTNLNDTKPLTKLEASEWLAYAWFGDEYVIMTRGGSEIGIMAAGTSGTSSEPQKITDYHRLPQNVARY